MKKLLVVPLVLIVIILLHFFGQSRLVAVRFKQKSFSGGEIKAEIKNYSLLPIFYDKSPCADTFRFMDEKGDPAQYKEGVSIACPLVLILEPGIIWPFGTRVWTTDSGYYPPGKYYLQFNYSLLKFGEKEIFEFSKNSENIEVQ